MDFDVDIVIDIYQTVNPGLGLKSRYATTPHPATGKKVVGWKWDERPWAEKTEIKSTDFAPSIFDASTNFIPEEYFQSGIGDNDDLALDSINEEQIENVNYWIPRINHGFFYTFDQEWYLYSDDARKEIIDQHLTLSGTLQYKDLTFKPKPGIPILVRRYYWNKQKSRYEVIWNFNKKFEFSGDIVNSEELATLADSGDFLVDNIDLTKKEFVIDYDRTTPRVILNDLYNDQIGISGNLSSLELLGISDGVTNEYHLQYAPVDPSGVFQLITWDPRTLATYSWSRIDLTQDFSEGPIQEFKLDEFLSTVIFGNYSSATTSGAGLIPPPIHKIGAVYTPGIEVMYEPENTRDWIEAINADINPLHNASNHGFVKVSSEIKDPSFITLRSDDLEGDAIDGYEIALSNTSGRLIATLYDSEGRTMDGERVIFDILDPVTGTFSNLEISTEAISNANGQAIVQFIPPTSIDDIGKATRNYVYDSSLNLSYISVDGLSAPDQLERVYLFTVRNDDPSQGIPESQQDSYLSEYLLDEGIQQDPSGGPVSTTFEKTFRQVNELLQAVTYPDDNLTIGTKLIVANVDPGVIDPNYAIQKPTTIAPIVPYQAHTSGSDSLQSLELTYSGQLNSLFDQAGFKAFFVATDGKARIRARRVNPLSGKVTYSNIISITIKIPPEASGVKLCEDLNDVESGLFRRTKNISEVSDSFIATYSGNLESEWLEDRLVTEEYEYVTWSGDDHTIAYWPLNGNLLDASSHGHNFTNVGMISDPTGGIVGGAFKSNGLGRQYLNAQDLYQSLEPQSGTIDFVFKTDSYIASGNSFSFLQILSSGNNSLRNNIEVSCLNIPASGILFRFNYEVSGVGNGPQAYIEDNLLDKGVIITDGEWHSFRVTWDFNQIDHIIRLGASVDNITLSGGQTYSTPLSFTPRVDPTKGMPPWNTFGDLFQYSVSGLVFDEIRISDKTRTDMWPPFELVETDESFIDWFRRTRRADSDKLLLQSMVFSGYVPARLPLGFRLKSSGNTVASMLDRVTFITLNDPLPDGYYDV